MEKPIGERLDMGGASGEPAVVPAGDRPNRTMAPEAGITIEPPASGQPYMEHGSDNDIIDRLPQRAAEVAAMGGRLATRIARTTAETGSRIVSSVNPDDARRVGIAIVTAVPTIVAGKKALSAVTRRRQAPPSLTDRVLGRIPNPFR